MYTLEGTVLIKYSFKFVRILISVKSRSSLKLGHIGSKTSLPGQILGKLGHIGSKTSSLGQMVEKPCVPSRAQF